MAGGSTDKACKNGNKNVNKPVMRGLHLRQTTRHIAIATVLSLTSGVLFYFLNNAPRKKAYEEFYKKYDANASFERMMEAGLLSSCQPEPPEPPKKKGLVCF